MLINALGVVKLCDLGNARPLDFNKLGQERLPVSQRILNLSFVSAEFHKDGIIGPFNDIESLGKTIYHALICTHRDVNDVMIRALDESSQTFYNFMKLNPIPEDFSKELRIVVESMVDPDWTKRPTAEDLASICWLTEEDIQYLSLIHI